MSIIKSIAKPFTWVRNQLSSKFPGITKAVQKIRRVVTDHPIISLTILFGVSVGINLLTGWWWIGVTVFLVALVAFSSTSTSSGFLKTLTAGTEVMYAIILAFMALAIMAPVVSYWWLYLLIPPALWAVKILHDLLVFSVISSEMKDEGFDLEELKA